MNRYHIALGKPPKKTRKPPKVVRDVFGGKMDDIRMPSGEVVYRPIDRMEFIQTNNGSIQIVTAKLLGHTCSYSFDAYDLGDALNHEFMQHVRNTLAKNLIEQIKRI